MEDSLTRRSCSAESITFALVEKQVTFVEDYVTVPLVAPGEKFSVPAALGAALSLLCNSEGLMKPGFCEMGLE